MANAWGTFSGFCFDELQVKKEGDHEYAPDYELSFGVKDSRRNDDGEWEVVSEFSVNLTWKKRKSRDGELYEPHQTLKMASLARKGSPVMAQGAFTIRHWQGKVSEGIEVRMTRPELVNVYGESLKDREIVVPGYFHDVEPDDDEEGEDLPW